MWVRVWVSDVGVWEYGCVWVRVWVSDVGVWVCVGESMGV